MTVADLCRVTVQTLSPSVTVDLVLPSRRELGELIPRVVDLAGERPETVQRWTLSRLDGSTLDESMTLHENGVRDGDVLWLGAGTRLPEPYFSDPSHFVAQACDRDCGWRRLGAITCMWSAAVGATALIWPGHSAASPRAVIAVIVAVATAVGAIVANRLDAEPLPTLTLGAMTVVFGAIAGYLAVPGGPAPPNFFLAAAVCSTSATVLLHATSRGTTLFVTIAAFSAVSAMVAAVVALWPVPIATVGAVLAAASLTMLGVAAKLTIVLTGLSPRMPGPSDPMTGDQAVRATIGVSRAQLGHRTLTGLLTGFSLTAALGAVLVAAGGHDENAIPCAAFTVAVSTVLVLRGRQQHGVIRSTAVFVAGLVSTAATFTLIAMSVPRHAPWLCLVVVVLGAGALLLTGTDVGSRMSPFARRGIEVVDYVSLVAVLPLACWISDLFGIVRGLSLS